MERLVATRLVRVRLGLRRAQPSPLHKQRRLEQAQKEKAAAQAKLEMIKAEAALVDVWIKENGHVDDEWTECEAPPEATPAPATTPESTDSDPVRINSARRRSGRIATN